MTMRPARTVALALSIALVVPPVVAAFPRPAAAQAKLTIREQLPTEARGHWDAGVALAKKGSWDAARASFRSAYELSHNPRVLYNVGISEKELQHFAAALETFKRELVEGKGQISADDEREVKQNVADLEKLVAHLTIDVNEKDADIYVDGAKIDGAKLPGPITVDLGERKLRATKPGFGEALTTVNLIGGGSGTAVLRLRPLVKTSRVNVAVLGPTNVTATVKIDGKEVGPAPYAGQVTVQADPHQFSAEAPGYVPTTQPVIVRDGEVMNVTLQLAMEQEKGKLIVTTRTEGAAIEIDGRVVGASHWEGPVDARIHQVTVKKTGFYPWTYDVDVPRGGERSVTANLNEDRNSSFVPWLIGSVVVGAAIVVGIVLLATPPDEKPQKGTLSPFTLGTQRFAPVLHF